MERVDVLVVAALPEEFKAAREAATAGGPQGRGVTRWEERDPDGSSPYLWGEYRIDGKPRFTMALARPTHMGGRTTGPFVATLVNRLHAASIAMCGVCAGDPGKTSLGDVVVGSPVYEWDEGKNSASGFQGDHQQFRMDDRWLRAAQEFDPVDLSTYGEATEDEALLWFLEQLHREQDPRRHPALWQYFPSGTWQPRLMQLEAQGRIRRDQTGKAFLTEAGSDHVQRRLYDDVEGPQRLPYRVLAAPMASGSAVITDSAEWDRLKAMGQRNITAIEMEAATIATVAHDQGIPWIVAKGVMDHADSRKDDRYKQFAARASAQVMFALLERLVLRPEAHKQRIAGVGRTAKTESEPPVVKPVPGAPAAGSTSAEQQNAVRSAEQYLDVMAFSRNGLTEQLISAGYPSEVATEAVDSLDIDYHEQATKSATQYLSVSPFSRNGLIEQLESDAGFTHSQAVHGIDQAGL